MPSPTSFPRPKPKFPTPSPNILKLTRSAHKIIPHMLCTNIHLTTTFYTQSLHFQLGGYHPDIPMASVFMGVNADANIYLFERRGQVDYGYDVKEEGAGEGKGERLKEDNGKEIGEEGEKKKEEEGQYAKTDPDTDTDTATATEIDTNTKFGPGVRTGVGKSTIMLGLGRSELEAYYELLVQEGQVKIVDGIADRAWEFRQFTAEDPDGNHIQFWAFMDD